MASNQNHIHVERRVSVRTAGPVLSSLFLTDLVGEVLRVTSSKGSFGLGVQFVGDQRIRTLNRQYRNKDSVTDVLSFSQLETADASVVFPEAADRTELGDVIVSVPQATRQSSHKNQSLKLELSWLVVHGTLHVLGYDHMTPADLKEMRRLERRVLSQFFPKEAASAILESI